MTPHRADDLAARLIAALDGAQQVAPITSSDPTFGIDDAYQVLHAITARRIAAGWTPAGRKVGFTNRTIWPLYGVDRPMWAHVWTSTLQDAADNRATVGIGGLLEARVEPEVVFGLRGPVPIDGEARAALDAVDWIAPGFEIVQSLFPGWRFKLPDCTASFGMHGSLVVGTRTPLDEAARDTLAGSLASFRFTLHLDDAAVATGRGSDVLDSPALALQHLARVVASQPDAAPLAAGEVVTTGTVTDAQPAAPGQRWRSDYGDLGLPAMELVVVD